jgi:hypothetical protein
MSDTETIGILVKALELIEANPAHWSQSTWHCGTSHCLAGFCDIVNDNKSDDGQLPDLDLESLVYDEDTSNFSRTHLKLDYLFGSDLSLRTLQTEIASLVERGVIDGYDSNGYDSDGYDSDGYDSRGIKSEE